MDTIMLDDDAMVINEYDQIALTKTVTVRASWITVFYWATDYDNSPSDCQRIFQTRQL